MGHEENITRAATVRAVPHGWLGIAAVSEPPHDPAVWSALPDAERALADTLSVARQSAFVSGRVALRAALALVAPARVAEAVLRTPRGAPALPPDVLGSISHKRRLAVALVAAPGPSVATLGVDLEDLPTEADLGRPDIAPRILTSREQRALVDVERRDALAYRRAVRLHFALKEAVYKAIDPHVHRHVLFREVDLDVDLTGNSSAGEAEVRLLLPEFAGSSYRVHAWWSEFDEHLLATAVGEPRG